MCTAAKRCLAAIAVIALSGAGAGCGSSRQGPLSAGDAARLRQAVQSIRIAALSGHLQSAHAAAGTLRGEINRLSATGRLHPDDARVLSIEAAHADGRVSAAIRAAQPAVAAAPSSTSPSGAAAPQPAASATSVPAAAVPTATPSPSAPQVGGGTGNGTGNGNGKTKLDGNGKGKNNGRSKGQGNGGGGGGGD